MIGHICANQRRGRGQNRCASATTTASAKMKIRNWEYKWTSVVSCLFAITTCTINDRTAAKGTASNVRRRMLIGPGGGFTCERDLTLASGASSGSFRSEDNTVI